MGQDQGFDKACVTVVHAQSKQSCHPRDGELKRSISGEGAGNDFWQELMHGAASRVKCEDVLVVDVGHDDQLTLGG